MSASQFIEQAILSSLPSAKVEVHSHDDVHFEVVVTSKSFSGLSLVAQHRMVHEALGKDWAEKVHAIALTTKIPSEESST